MNSIEDAFNKYFATEENKKEDYTKLVAKKNDETYTYRTEENNMRIGVEKHELKYDVSPRLKADANIDNLQQICEVLRQLCNAAWGSDWGEISPDLKHGDNSSEIILPQITVDINERDIAEHMPLKPVLTDTIKETIDGVYTGDSLLLYRQWFDCNLEFDFYGRTTKEVRELQYKFEILLQVYAGYLKRHGLSEILFLKEFPSKNSLNFTDNVPMKTLIFYTRLERITPVRMSLINKVNTAIGLKEISNDTINTVVEHNQSINMVSESNQASLEFEDIDIDFNNEDVDYSGI